MASSTCVRCGGTSFEVVKLVPKESKFILLSVQCESCGGVAGVMDYYNLGDLLMMIRADLKRLEGLLD